MAKSGFKIKLSPGMKPYVGRVVRGGKVQLAFAKGPGKSVGDCVKLALEGKKGEFSGGQVKDKVRDCVKANWPKHTKHLEGNWVKPTF